MAVTRTPISSSIAKAESNKNAAAPSSVSDRTTPRATVKTIGNNQKGKNKKEPKKKTGQKLGTVILKKMAKIDNLPKNVRQSIPFRGIMQNGIIETYPGTFTKSYKLDDVNFNIAPDEEQMSIFNAFMDLLNSFNEKTRWQFTIFNHEIDKKKTIEDIRIAPQRDGLNKYRQEMNTVLLNNLKKGNNSIKQEKYLTVAVDDNNAEHAATVLRRTDAEISKKIKRISRTDTKPMTSQERMKLLYSIYNQDSDYRLATGILDGKEEFNLDYIERIGLSVKDVIGPTSFNFAPGTSFMMGDMYAQALFLEKVPTYLSTSFLADLSDIQCNMLISTTSEAINQERAVKLVKNQLASIEAQATSITKRNGERGIYAQLPPDLEKSQESARSLIKDLTGRDQNLFFVTFLVVVFARTKDQLEENVKLVTEVGGKHLCPIKPLHFQQEFALNTALPLCRNDLTVDRLYTTESASVFIPYNSQEINQKNAIFYGLNQTTKSMVLFDRTTGDNYNGLIFGYPGSGKSFTAKLEMLSVLLNHPDAQVFVIDPQGEYKPLANALKGEVIKLSPGSNVFINPMDLNLSQLEDEESDPVTMKSDFIISMFDIILGKNRALNPIHSSIIDKCIRKIYKPYIEEMNRLGQACDLSKCPTLSDLYQELMMLKVERYEAGQLADALYQYAVGSFNTFAHRTNVKTDARFVVYDTKTLGTGMRELGLHICINDVWNRMIENSKKHIYTWFYIDEFHVLLDSENTTRFLRKIWKMARKWLGVPTGIMQNTEDLLRDSDTRAIVNNTSMVIMLAAPLMDRQNLAELFHLSQAQLDFITNSEPGHGLIYNGKVTIPFGFDFPTDTEIYKILTTKHDVKDAQFA
jgi:type IV secretory pathway VirB4 component